MESIDMAWCLVVNARRIYLPVSVSDFVSLLGQSEPTMDHRLIDLQVKLKTVNPRTIAEGLIGTKRRKGEVRAGFGNVECLAVPLKDFFRVLQCRQQRVTLSVVCRGDVVPANFLFLALVNSGAKCFGD